MSSENERSRYLYRIQIAPPYLGHNHEDVFLAHTALPVMGTLLVGDLDTANCCLQPVAVYAPGRWLSALRIEEETT